MKYIKLFENIEDILIIEKIQNISDVLYNLSDIGFDTYLGCILYDDTAILIDEVIQLIDCGKVKTEWIDHISIKIKKGDNSEFTIEGDNSIKEIKDSLLTILSILGSNRHEIDIRYKEPNPKIYTRINTRINSKYGIELEDNKFSYKLPPFEPLLINWAILQMIIKIKLT